MKICTLCKEEKLFDQFHVHRIGKKGKPIYFSRCKSCDAKKSKERRLSKPKKERQEIARRNREKMGKEYFKEYRLKKRYGISIETLNEMLDQQQNSCKICSDKFTEKRPAQVDHCHSTGNVRNLLCVACNTSLGLMKEDVRRLTKMIEYINENN